MSDKTLFYFLPSVGEERVSSFWRRQYRRCRFRAEGKERAEAGLLLRGLPVRRNQPVLRDRFFRTGKAKVLHTAAVRSTFPIEGGSGTKYRGASTRSFGPEEPAGSFAEDRKNEGTSYRWGSFLMEGRSKAAIPLLWYGGKGNSLS